MADRTPLDELQWKNPEWIQAFGLRTDNVLEYFSESPFFDRTSNNQAVKMQSQFNENIQLNSYNIEFELQKMVGLEYVILYKREPDFWIIRKQNRLNRDKVEPISDYYIIGANVYMSPNVKDVISARLLSTALSLGHSLNKIQSLAQFSPSDGHTYKNIDSTNLPPSSSASRPRTIGNTPYTPVTPTVSANGINSSQELSLSKATLDNLLNISLNGSPNYLDDEEEVGEDSTSQLHKPIVVSQPDYNGDELSIQSLKKGKKLIK